MILERESKEICWKNGEGEKYMMLIYFNLKINYESWQIQKKRCTWMNQWAPFRNMSVAQIMTITSFLWLLLTYSFIPVIVQGRHDSRKQDSCDCVCPSRAHRSAQSASSSLPGVPHHLPHHYGGQPWTDCSHLEGPSPSYSHVLIPGKFSFCWCMCFILCDPQDACQFLIQGS